MFLEQYVRPLKNSDSTHFCSTCHKKIDHISRVLILRDRDGEPCVFFYHFFFPCWNLEQFCQQHPKLCIDRVGFSFPQDLKINLNSIQEMKKNLQFWVWNYFICFLRVSLIISEKLTELLVFWINFAWSNRNFLSRSSSSIIVTLLNIYYNVIFILIKKTLIPI